MITREQLISTLPVVRTAWHYVPDHDPRLPHLRELVREGVIRTQPGVSWRDAICFQRGEEGRDG